MAPYPNSNGLYIRYINEKVWDPRDMGPQTISIGRV
jgi:hypothetical protein